MSHSIRRALLAVSLSSLLSAVAVAQGPGDIPTDPSPTGVEFSPGFVLGQLVVGAIVAALLIHLAPQFTRSTVGYVHHDTAATGVVGFAALVGTFVVSFILVLTMIGALVGIPLLIGLILLLIPASIVAQIALGVALYRATASDGRGDLDSKTLWIGYAIGFVVLTIAGQIPVVSVLASLGVISLGLGALVQHWREGAHGGEGTSDNGGAVQERWNDSQDGGSWETTSDDGWGADRDGGRDGSGEPRGNDDEFGRRDDESDESSRRDDSGEFW